MKKLLIIPFLAIIILSACKKDEPALYLCGQRFYYNLYEKFDGKIFLNETRVKMMVVFSDTLPFEEMYNTLTKYSFIKPLQQGQSSNDIAIPDLDKDLPCSEIKQGIEKLKTEEKVLFASLFLNKEHLLIGITSTFQVTLKDTADYHLLEETANEFQSIISHKLDDTSYFLKATALSPGDGLETANKFFETGKFTLSMPIFAKYTRDFLMEDGD